MPPSSWWQRPRFWLAVMVVGFFAISFYAGVASYLDLQTQNSTDAGIFTQAFASTIHGHATPFYESYDCMVKERCSFLIVHPAFVLYAAVPFYALVPSTLTLFAIRAVLVSAAAIPLYWLTRQVTGSPAKALLAAGMFFAWMPSFVGDAFSVHLESLLPLELFTLAALWYAGRYRLGLAVAVVTFLTFEIFPIFTFLLGAFFLYPYLEASFLRGWRQWRSEKAGWIPFRAGIGFALSEARAAWQVREVRYLAVLMVSSVAAFVVISLFLNDWGAQVLGIASPSIPPGVGGLLSNNSSPTVQSLPTILQSPQTLSSAEYWLLAYALVAFIPLLSARSLILSLPWIGWSFLTVSSRFTTFGHEYSLIAAGPLFIGLAFGLDHVPFGRPHARSSAAEVPVVSPAAMRRRDRANWRRRLPSQRATWVGVLLVVFVANGILTPFNPLVPDLGLVPGAPFQPGFFNHSLAIDPYYVWVQKLVSTIPYDALVAAQSSVFQLVANDPHAYALASTDLSNLSYLPLNLSAGPQYALIYRETPGMLGPPLYRNITNPALYGLSGYVGSTAIGPVLLYEKGVTGAATRFGPALPPLNASYTPGNGIAAGPRGVELDNASSPTGRVVETLNTTNRTGLVWTTNGVFLPSSNYTVQVEVMVTGTNLTVHPTERALRIVVEGFGGLPLNTTILASGVVPGRWMNLSFTISLVNPLPNAIVEGYLASDQFSVAVASESIEPTVP
jgi:uncharacterized membrane protein